MNQVSLHDIDWSSLPTPLDDGLCDHLTGVHMPDCEIPSTSDQSVNFGTLPGLSVLFFYPMTARPGVALPADWDSIPGARGCTPEACAFNNLIPALRAAGAKQIYGIATQPTEYQQEVVTRLKLDYPLLSDEAFELTNTLNLPTFDVEKHRLIKRVTVLVKDGCIIKVFYPIFPPDEHPQQVLGYLSDNPS